MQSYIADYPKSIAEILKKTDISDEHKMRIPEVWLDLPYGIPGCFELADEAHVIVSDPPGLDVLEIKGTWGEVKKRLEKSIDDPNKKPFLVAADEEIWKVFTPTGGGLERILEHCEDVNDRNRRRNRQIEDLRQENKKLRNKVSSSE
mgnify:CR=1 FL=1